jgi:ABC-type sugar transport system permease subunit
VLGAQTKWLSDPTPVLNVSAWAAPSVRRLADWHLAPVGGLLDFVAAGLTTTKAFWVMSLVGVWVAFPFMLLIATTALRAVPPDVYAAAQMDGASGWTLWRTITWPLIRPSIWSGMLLRGILLFNAFYIPLLLISGRNTGTETLAFLSYMSLRFDNSYSVSARLNTFALLAVMVLVWWFNRRTQIIEAEE